MPDLIRLLSDVCSYLIDASCKRLVRLTMPPRPTYSPRLSPAAPPPQGPFLPQADTATRKVSAHRRKAVSPRPPARNPAIITVFIGGHRLDYCHGWNRGDRTR